MRSDLIVIAGIGPQKPAQMRLTQNYEMVHAFTPDRSDQPYGKSILPRRSWCSGLVPNTHGTQPACDDGSVDAIQIANKVLRDGVPRECLRYLTSNPFSRRICCNVDPDELSTAQTDNDEGIK